MTTTDTSKRRYTFAVVCQDGTRHSFHNQDQETLDLSVVRVTSGLGLLLQKGGDSAFAFGPGDIARLGVQRTADAEEGGK